MTPRYYQSEAIEKCVQHFWRKCPQHAVCVLPTGAGKSLVIAHIVEKVGGNFLVLQPSKEILEQNIAKYRALGKEASIYSAILGQKVRTQVTYATIGSIMANRRDFDMFQNIIVDECHIVNAAKGMYEYFLRNVPGLVCIGLTATPYRLKSSGNTSVIEFLTRTRPNFFQKVIHVTQQNELREAGFLAPIAYKKRGEINLKNVVVKNGEYEENSLLREMNRASIEDLIIQEIEILEQSEGGILVFVEFIEILKKIQKKRPDLQYITGTTDSDERDDLLEKFKNGQVQTILNVGVLTTGFDYPALSRIIVAKATRSLSLWYQIIGRGQRIADGKTECLVVDMCDNLSVLGDVQKLEVKEINGRWVVTMGASRIITNKAF